MHRPRASDALGRLLSSTLLTTLATLAGGNAEAQTSRDSAGARLVTYGADDRPKQRWRIVGAPKLQLGGGEPGSATDFLDIVGVAVLFDGAVAVGNGATNEIRIFDQKGRFTRAVGRGGQGPGEFDRLFDMWRIRDTLVGFDRRGIAQVFSPDGKYLRTEPRPQAPPGARIFRRAGYLDDSGLLYYWPDGVELSTEGWSTTQLTLMKRRRAATSVLGRFPLAEMLRRDNRPVVYRIFGPAGYVVALRHFYCVGYSETYAFRCFSGEGRLQSHVVRHAFATPRRVTDEDRRRYFEGVEKANPGERGKDFVEATKSSTIFAERLAAYGRFIGSRADELWISPPHPNDLTPAIRHPVPDRPLTWSVFSPFGVWLSDLTVPAGFRLLDAGHDHISGITVDGEGVERVVVYRLLRQ